MRIYMHIIQKNESGCPFLVSPTSLLHQPQDKYIILPRFLARENIADDTHLLNLLSIWSNTLAHTNYNMATRILLLNLSLVWRASNYLPVFLLKRQAVKKMHYYTNSIVMKKYTWKLLFLVQYKRKLRSWWQWRREMGPDLQHLSSQRCHYRDW